MKEGIKLPTHYPLTKSEEKELKRIRRKIRNKISAQDSRKRKKEYVDGLEERVKRGSEENKFLLKRVKQLQKQNSRLMAQLSKLQALIFDNSSTKATPATCLMIVLFSALLVSLPNMRVAQDKELGDQQQIAARRALLFSHSATNEEDTLNMEEFLLFGKEDSEGDDRYSKYEEQIEKVDFSKILEQLNKNLETGESNCSESEVKNSLFFETCKKFEKEIKDTVHNLKTALNDFNNEINDDKAMKNKHGFYEPDIDDDWSPSETIKTLNIKSVADEYEHSAKRAKREHDVSSSEKNVRMSTIVGAQHKINASEI
ncbi:cyclic AMP-responsive element-binding protein 3-like protein 4 [Agrilus planipennis]|uniref:Cyclic AMP-responsive element-binding protein 3-like protein 4 n=1 Tax=Agrilus planipennis TaxID=224129 RepID=A0A7F5R4Y0_AGRPL|nr:cyclic AMP-responsive element-binding protein 3-like protein 4 [Agrilus planipennis]